MSEQGAHYKIAAGEQHHERAIRLKMNWYAANITKYAERAPHKGQLAEDLIKVLDYTCMWLTSPEGPKLTDDQRNRINTVVHKFTPAGKDTWPWTPALAKVKPEHLVSQQLEEYDPMGGTRRNTE